MKTGMKKWGDGAVVIKPVQQRRYDLAELLKGITRKNLHEEADFGRPVGKEMRDGAAGRT
jgi:antitoxin MazE